MRIECSVSESDRRFIVRLGDVVVLDTLRTIMRAQIEAGVWSWPCVIDMSEVTEMAVTPREIEDLVSFVRDLVLPDVRGPVVIYAPEPKVLGVCRMLVSLAEGHLLYPIFATNRRYDIDEFIAAASRSERRTVDPV